MTIYAVGDIQGCFEPLQQLLEDVEFDTQQDQLWCVGDLVNRGPHSLKTLRFLYEIKDSVITVLGNHDLHLLACYYDPTRLKKHDTIKEVIEAKDADKLITWLRKQPLVYYHSSLNITMVHAGIPPSWTLEESLQRSFEVESVLQDDEKIIPFLQQMYGSDPVNWKDSLTGQERLRVITNYFTRMRFSKLDGTIEFKSKEGVGKKPEGYMPWFNVPNRKMAGNTIVFGHWAALEGHCNELMVYALDTGCVWGNCMTLMDVVTKRRYNTKCPSKKHK